MTLLLKLLTNKLAVNLAGIIALSFFIWYGARYVKFGDPATSLSFTQRIIVILVVWIIWGIIALIKLWRDRSQNQELVENIESSNQKAQEDEENNRSKEEIATLNDRFTSALGQLKKSKFASKHGKKSLYELPWYIIIGPPGAGKTTMLTNSGLRFPLAESHGEGALGGVGGTRNCDWWFTDEAVLLDTAGRYTTQDSHRSLDNSAWHGFLQLLSKYRRRQPINGAVIAISAEDLIMQTEEQRGHLGKTIQARLDELHEHLGIQFPVYVLITKCDLIAGFSDYFANASQQERNQVWGTTFPLDEEASYNRNYLSEQFDLLTNRVSAGTLQRINTERDIQKRALIHNFPLQVNNLKASVLKLMDDIFAASRYKQQALVRGVYLSSATQQGTPIDRIMAAVNQQFGLERDQGQRQLSSGKSFFINHLLTEVIFPEASLVGVNKRLENIIKWVRRSLFGGMAITFIGTIAVWVSSITGNYSTMEDVDNSVTQFEVESAKLTDSNRNIIATLPSLNALWDAANAYNQESHPLLANLGLYNGSVDKNADLLYKDQLQELLLPRLAYLLESDLSTNTDTDQLFDSLRLYLLTAKAQPETKLTDTEKADIHQWAQSQWQPQLEGKATEQQQLSDHVTRLLDLDYKPFPPNQRLVDATRLKIQQLPIAQRLYAQLKSSPEFSAQRPLYEAVGNETLAVYGAENNAQSLPYLFTKPGFENLDFSPNSPSLAYVAENRWVMGTSEGEDFSQADLEKIGKDIEALYLVDYSNYWNKLLGEMHLSPFNSMQQGVERLNLLSDPVYSPIKNMLVLASDNTRLRPIPETPPAEGSAEELFANQAEPTSVDKQFQQMQRLVVKADSPSGLNSTLAAIKELQTYMATISTAPNPDQAAYLKAKGRFQGAADSISKIRSLAASAPAPMQTWLLELADHSWSLLLAGSQRHINSIWQQDVYSLYQRTLSNRFPLANNDTEASLQDFNSFFRPGAAIDQFVQEYLTAFVNTRTWKSKSLEGRNIGLSSRSLKQLANATAIRQAFFRESASNASASFTLTPIKMDAQVSQFDLDLGTDQPSLGYSHGPKIGKSLKWSGANMSRIRLIFEDLNGNTNQEAFNGDWALFRLLDNSNLKRNNSSSFEVSFEVSGRKANYELKATSSINPFNRNLLTDFNCPQRL